MKEKKHTLSLFSLTMMTVVSVDSIRNLPATALLGSQLVSYFILGALFFLIPVALVSAELSSGWPKRGGIYVWVKEAFGPRVGFLAIWLQWISNVIWYPLILSFVASSVSYLFASSLSGNPWFLWASIGIVFCAMTLLNLRGLKAAAWFSNFSSLLGLLLPMTLIIILGVVWLMQGHASAIDLHWTRLLPDWSQKSMWVSLVAIILSFGGMEIATVHANDVADPQRTFPKALLYSVLILLSTLILGSLAIAVVLPQQEISLVAGIMQAYEIFFAKYHLSWMMPLVALMLISPHRSSLACSGRKSRTARQCAASS